MTVFSGLEFCSAMWKRMRNPDWSFEQANPGLKISESNQDEILPLFLLADPPGV
jgi:hypothetical protein